MTRDQIASTAAGIMSAAAAGLSLFVAPMLESANLTLKLLALALTTAGFYVVFLTVTHFLAWLRYRKLLGKWYYVTHPHPDSPYQDGNYAIMTFRLNRDYDIEYAVYLYGKLDDLNNPQTAAMRGSATSKALHYAREAGRVYIVFEVNPLAGDPQNVKREGRLSLEFNPHGWLEGNWTSEVYTTVRSKPVRTVSSGAMAAFSTIDGLKTYQRARGAEA